jgi:hypothetical protein
MGFSQMARKICTNIFKKVRHYLLKNLDFCIIAVPNINAFVLNCFYFFQDGQVSFEADRTCEMTLRRAPATLPLTWDIPY